MTRFSAYGVDLAYHALELQRILTSLCSLHQCKNFLLPKTICLKINICTFMDTDQFPVYNFVVLLNKFMMLSNNQDHSIYPHIVVPQCTYYHISQIFGDPLLNEFHGYSYTQNEPLATSLCQALRREPYLSSCRLKKSQSLDDLRYSNHSLVKVKPGRSKLCQSCPDILELEALIDFDSNIEYALFEDINNDML